MLLVHVCFTQSVSDQLARGLTPFGKRRIVTVTRVSFRFLTEQSAAHIRLDPYRLRLRLIGVSFRNQSAGKLRTKAHKQNIYFIECTAPPSNESPSLSPCSIGNDASCGPNLFDVGHFGLAGPSRFPQDLPRPLYLLPGRLQSTPAPGLKVTETV